MQNQRKLTAISWLGFRKKRWVSAVLSVVVAGCAMSAAERAPCRSATKMRRPLVRRSSAKPNSCKWWSQNEGLGIVLTLDLLGDSSWKRHASDDGAKTLLEMLDDVLEE